MNLTIDGLNINYKITGPEGAEKTAVILQGWGTGMDLYDFAAGCINDGYRIVQFDFPNHEGKPYKSSGGELDYIDLLKREIPESWELVSLNDFVAQRISGDWGNETETTQNSIKVSCIRGADLKTLEDLPTRFIADNHINRLLKPLNVIIEMSGGSPTQSTGRSAIILKETIDDNNNAVVCSNFCQAISPLKEFELYFYFTSSKCYTSEMSMKSKYL